MANNLFVQAKHGSVLPRPDAQKMTAITQPGDNQSTSLLTPSRSPSLKQHITIYDQICHKNTNETAMYWLGVRPRAEASGSNGNKSQNQSNDSVSTPEDHGHANKRRKIVKYSWLQSTVSYRGRYNADMPPHSVNGTNSPQESSTPSRPPVAQCFTAQSSQGEAELKSQEKAESDRTAQELRLKERKIANRKRKTEWQRRDRAKKRKQKAQNVAGASAQTASTGFDAFHMEEEMEDCKAPSAAEAMAVDEAKEAQELADKLCEEFMTDTDDDTEVQEFADKLCEELMMDMDEDNDADKLCEEWIIYMDEDKENQDPRGSDEDAEGETDDEEYI